MARPLNQVITEIRSKIEKLATQRDEALETNRKLNEEMEQLRKQLEECREELKETRMEVDFMTVSYRLAESPEHIISARRRVQRLISKIDRCVSLLKDDADIS